MPEIEADDDRREAARRRCYARRGVEGGPDDELSESRHAKPIKPVEAVPEKVRAVSFDIEQPVVSSSDGVARFCLEVEPGEALHLILCCVRAPGATSCRAEPTLRAE